MISGVGIDIVDIKRIEKLIEKHGGRFVDRVFSQEEIAYCSAKKNSAESFAARFAVKEAFVKAIGTGVIKGMRFTDVSLEFKDRPVIRLSGVAKAAAEAKGITSMHASVSHERKHAVAVVILEV